MSVTEQILLAEAMRSYFVEHCAFLPVKGGAFLLDDLLPEGASMNLQLNGGQALHRWIDGSRVMAQPFTIFYRGPIADSNVNREKSRMLGVLNGIGEWMEQSSLPYFGDWLTVTRFEQVQTANIAEQNEKFVTYQAGYMLGYETTP